MGEATEVRDKAQEEIKDAIEEVAAGSKGYKKLVLTIGAALVPIIGYIFQDMYFTMKSTSIAIAELRIEMSEVRSGEIDKMWSIMNTFRKDIAENKIRLEVLDRLYGAESYTMQYGPTTEDLEWEMEDMRQMQIEMMHRLEEQMLEDFQKVENEAEQYRKMEQQFQDQEQRKK